jgi:hypothetical protein
MIMEQGYIRKIISTVFEDPTPKNFPGSPAMRLDIDALLGKVGHPRAAGSGLRKKINVLVKECFGAVLPEPVEGMRDRWAG